MNDMEILWNEPYKVKVGTIDHWRRNWLIPKDARPGFFDFWRESKFQLLADGFRVYKEDDEWFLSETKLSQLQFKNIGITKKANEPPPLSDFLLPVYDITDETGLRPWQAVAAGRIVSALNEWGAAIDGSDTGVGKCLTKGTKVKMYDGSTKNVEDVKVGDWLRGDDNYSRVVKSLARGEDDLYRIVPTKYGEEWGCNSEHILVLYNSRTKELGEFSIKEYLEKSSKSTRFKSEWKLIRTAVEYPDRDLGISPYFLGLWIGDGTWNSVSITASEDEKEIIKFLYYYAPYTGSRVVKSRMKPGSKAITFYFRGYEHGYNGLLNEFRSYGLIKSREKFIPKEYLICESYKRRSLLAGIIDSDGTKCNNGCYEIVTKWDRLKEDIVELARSLGYGVTYKKRKVLAKNNNFNFTGEYWRIHISGAHDIPCQVERKKSTRREQIKSVLVSGFEIIPLGRGDYYGFEITGNRRFLLGDFTITHNTYTACAVARDMGLKMVVVCPKAVISSWKEVIHNHFHMDHQLIAITNYEQLRIGKSNSNLASYVIPRSTRRKTFTWKVPKDTLIIWDESQKLKNWTTKNAKTCIAATEQGYKQLFCSATNATNPLELRTVGHALKMFKGKSAATWYQWVKEHGCYKGTWGMEFTSDPKLRQKVLKKLHKDIFLDRGVRLRRDTIPNFPECDLFAVLLDMEKEDTAKINAIYDDMEKELKQLQQLQKLNKHNHLVVELRYRQQIELVKVPLFIDMIEEAKEEGFSIVVFVNFTDTITALANRLGISCIFDGKVGDSTRELNKQKFQNNEEQVILVNVMSGGGGLSLHDLHGGHPRLSLISPSYSPVNMRQAIGRIWRDDAKTKAIQKLVCVAHTVEETVYHNVTKKLNNLDLLNDGDLRLSLHYEEIRQ